jgi:hypothetical protein
MHNKLLVKQDDAMCLILKKQQKAIREPTKIKKHLLFVYRKDNSLYFASITRTIPFGLATKPA